MSIEEAKKQFDSLVSERDSLKEKIAANKALIESTKETLDKYKIEMKEKFDVDSIEEAKAKVKALEDGVNEALNSCEELLETGGV